MQNENKGPLLTTEAVTAEQIAEWKAKNPRGVFALPFEKDDNTVITGYFRKPTITELDQATAGVQNAPLKSMRILYNTCFLGGHPEFKDNEDVVLAGIKAFGEINKTQEIAVKKL